MMDIYENVLADDLLNYMHEMDDERWDVNIWNDVEKEYDGKSPNTVRNLLEQVFEPDDRLRVSTTLSMSRKNRMYIRPENL